MRRAARVDENQPRLVQEIRQIFGPDSVTLLHGVGQGCPDIALGTRGVNLLLEIKRGKNDLTPDQVYFHRNWDGQVDVVETIEDVLAVVARETT